MEDKSAISVSDHEKSGHQARRMRLSRLKKSRTSHSHAYSRFVRWMRLMLPLAALGIVTVLFIWPDMRDEVLVSIRDRTGIAQTIGKNEMIKPRFESKDRKKQPYTITARRAIQGKSDDALVLLEKPVADMLLNNGNWIALEADKGAYRQDTQKLLLQGKVRLFHDRGYQIETGQLHIDLKDNATWSETDIYGQGPEGTLEAKGMKGYGENGHLVFTGPARLVLNRSIKGPGE